MDSKQKTVQDYETQIREIQAKKAAGIAAVSIIIIIIVVIVIIIMIIIISIIIVIIVTSSNKVIIIVVIPVRREPKTCLNLSGIPCFLDLFQASSCFLSLTLSLPYGSLPNAFYTFFFLWEPSL